MRNVEYSRNNNHEYRIETAKRVGGPSGEYEVVFISCYDSPGITGEWLHVRVIAEFGNAADERNLEMAELVKTLLEEEEANREDDPYTTHLVNYMDYITLEKRMKWKQ